MSTDLETRATAVLASVMRVPALSIAPTASSMTIPHWDSVNHMKLILALEEEFQVTFTELQIIEMTALPRLLEIVRSSVAERERA